MAATDESQGLKIAVAAFVTLTVILAVTSYFLYSAYSQAEARLQLEIDKVSRTQKAQSDALSQYEEFRRQIGVHVEEFEPAKTEIATHFKKMDERLDNLASAVNTAVEKAKAAGAPGPELEDAKAKVQQIVTSYRNEPNKNFIATLDRLIELLEDVALVNTEVSLNYVDLRANLESTTAVAKQQIDAQAKAAADSRTDLAAEHTKHESERQTLLARVDQLQTDNDKKAAEIANLTTQNRQIKEEFERKLELANSITRELRDQLERNEVVLDRPDGYITYVDLDRREVQVNVTRRQGARPQMNMTVFDAASPGIPTERPKGNIQLLQVGGEYSIARIVRTNSTIDPIRVGDIVYSPAWSPDEPMRFALVGKIDVNRDGKDDREDLKRLIEDSGGGVDYDLPPPEYGKESGKLTARIAWYVIDDRRPLREVYRSKSEATLVQQSEFEKRYGEVVKEARLNGIRPMPIGRLLAYLGYELGTPIVGRAEAVNASALRRLTQPRQRTEHPRFTAESPKIEMPKAEEPKLEETKTDRPN
jgi:hypothetical protein